MIKSNPYRIEVLNRSGQWLVVGSSKTESSAHKRGRAAMKQIKGLEYRVIPVSLLQE